jgi:hypothetical protein
MRILWRLRSRIRFSLHIRTHEASGASEAKH